MKILPRDAWVVAIDTMCGLEFEYCNSDTCDSHVSMYVNYKDAVRSCLKYARDRIDQGLEELKNGRDPEVCLSRIGDGEEWFPVHVQWLADKQLFRLAEYRSGVYNLKGDRQNPDYWNQVLGVPIP